MDEKTQAAFDRIHAAVDGKPREFVTMKVGEDRDGNDVMREVRPLVEIAAGDTLTLTNFIPKEQRSQIVKDLRWGVLELAPELKVRQQARCLWHLLDAVMSAAGTKKTTPAAGGQDAEGEAVNESAPAGG